jgi:hypothetical protein
MTVDSDAPCRYLRTCKPLAHLELAHLENAENASAARAAINGADPTDLAVSSPR